LWARRAEGASFLGEAEAALPPQRGAFVKSPWQKGEAPDEREALVRRLAEMGERR
jgi:hypothetical protein